MTEADRIFARFPDYIREYIYAHSWDSLRQVQIEAARCIFETRNHLLLTTSTASGKTEAAFFPILSEFAEDMPHSIGVLYVAPLKSLINDQFARMEDVLRESGVPVTHWHGDVAASHKKKLLENPRGILQITPESLESMLINRSNDISRLFADLRYVVLDELHTLTGTDRGNQILCQLARLSHRIGHVPRRIGLSALCALPLIPLAAQMVFCEKRTEEWWILRSIGRTRRQRRAQFIAETGLLTLLLSMVTAAACPLGYLLVMMLAERIGTSLPPSAFDPRLYIGILALVVVSGLLAGGIAYGRLEARRSDSRPRRKEPNKEVSHESSGM